MNKEFMDWLDIEIVEATKITETLLSGAWSDLWLTRKNALEEVKQKLQEQSNAQNPL